MLLCSMIVSLTYIPWIPYALTELCVKAERRDRDSEGMQNTHSRGCIRQNAKCETSSRRSNVEDGPEGCTLRWLQTDRLSWQLSAFHTLTRLGPHCVKADEEHLTILRNELEFVSEISTDLYSHMVG